MRFLLDQNLSPALVGLLVEADHDAEHVGDLGMSEAPDDEVMTAAKNAGAVLISSDTDFGELLAHSNASEPSVMGVGRIRWVPAADPIRERNSRTLSDQSAETPLWGVRELAFQPLEERDIAVGGF